MYIDASAIIEIGKVIGAIMVICGLPISIYKWYSRQNDQDVEIKKMKEEQCLLTYGTLACLKGLKELGCNGAVTEAIDKMEKHLNKAAHDQE
jgi:hypothetical protein